MSNFANQMKKDYTEYNKERISKEKKKMRINDKGLCLDDFYDCNNNNDNSSR